MLVAFFESLKYVGHYYPVAFLRIYLGYYYLHNALDRASGDFLHLPKLSSAIMNAIPQSYVVGWYAGFLQSIVVPNWKFFAYLLMYLEFMIGVSFLVGFLVRPAAILGAILALNFVYFGGPDNTSLQQTHLALFLVLGWLGAGRCLGIDYYFYKRQRGLWW
jgi:thiosulfate dehydrogenase (quinone) large subunit